MISLHAHSDFSALDGYGFPEDIVKRCLELGRKAVCLTDHDTVYSHPYLQMACEKEKGIKPIFGCEMRMVPDIKFNDRSKNHITIIAKNKEGYRNLMRLITASYKEECFYYYPTIDLNMLEECGDGLVVLTGCPDGFIGKLALNNEVEKTVPILKRLYNRFQGDLYLEVMAHDFEQNHIIAPVIRALHNKYKVPLVLTNDEHYLVKGGHELWKILSAIKFRMKAKDLTERLPTLYYMTDDEAFQHTKEVIGDYFTDAEIASMFANQEKIASDCNVILDKGIFEPNFGVEDANGLLTKLAWEGLERRGFAHDEEYRERLERELELAKLKKFSDYFLIVQDIVNWCKRNDIWVGHSRGSVGGSLLSYSLRITEVDPIKHGLILERFISEVRTDLPDIDIDFQDDKRDEVIAYIKMKYGDDNVANLSTIITFKGKNSLMEIGKVFGIPPFEIEKVKNVLVERGSADARSSMTIEDTFNEFSDAKDVAERYPQIMYATQLEGHVRHFGRHAAGILVSRTPLYEITAISKDGAAMLDGVTAPYVGMLKMDILGLKTLTMLKEMAHDVGMETVDELYALPIEGNPDVYKEFNGDCVGIFQFDSPSTSSIARQYEIKNFHDVVMATSLCLSGDTEIQVVQKFSLGDPSTKLIKDVKEGDVVVSVSKDYSMIANKVIKVWDKGLQKVYKLETVSGKSIKATEDHLFLTFDGWRKLKELNSMDRLYTIQDDYICKNEIVDSIVCIGMEHTYDLAVENKEAENYIANHFIVHNSRPGPLHSQQSQLIINCRKNNDRKIWDIPLMNEITKDTYGYVTFQEQVMSTFHELGDMDWDTVGKVRNAMSKSYGDEYFDQFREIFRKGAEKKYGISKEYADEIFNHTSHFGCLSWNTRIKTPDGWKTIENLYRDQEQGKKVLVPSIDPTTGDVTYREPIAVVYSGKKKVNWIQTFRHPWGYSSKNSGRRIRTLFCTDDHKFLDSSGEWKKLSTLKAGDKIYIHKKYGSDNYKHYSIQSLNKKLLHNRLLTKDGNVWNKGLTIEDERVKDYVKKSIDARSDNGTFNKWGYGKCSIARDGHFCQSSFELEFENWMIDNEIRHIPHPRIRNTSRIADYLVGEFYIELDGMQPKRTDDYWKDKYENDLSNVIIIYPNDSFDKLKDEILSCVDPEPFVDFDNTVLETICEIKFVADNVDTYDIIMEPEQPNFIADGFVVHNSWAFNLAHAVGYSYMSYATAWFKAKYPRIFYKVLCNHANDEELKSFLRRYIENGFGKILPPKINKSGYGWTIEGNNLRAGLSSVLPQKAAENIVSIYPIKDMADLEERSTKRIVNIRVRNKVEEMGMFMPDEDIDCFGIYDFAKRMARIDGIRTHKIGDLGYDFNMRNVIIAGVMNEAVNLKSITELEQTIKTGNAAARFDKRYGDEWCVLYLRDETDTVINVHVKNYLFPQYKNMLFQKKIGEDILVVKGIIPPGMSHLVAKEIYSWDDKKAPKAKCYECSLIGADFCPPIGPPDAKIMCIGMCPGQIEIQRQEPFSGKAGQILNEAFEQEHVDRSTVYLTNSALCRATYQGRNCDPDDIALASCKDRLLYEIATIKPKVILAFGKLAYHNLTGNGADTEMWKLVGKIEEVGGYKIIPCYHPASCLYDGGEKNKKSIAECIKIASEIAKR